MTEKKTITIIAAMARNRAIGLDGQMPWHLPGELQHFKRTTMGKAVVMGRKTHEAIGRPLPGRQNIVVSRQPGYLAAGCEVAASLEAAIALAQGAEVMIIGGGELYRQALPLASRMVLTLVDCAPEADTWFPEWPARDWLETGRSAFRADDANPLDYEVVRLERTGASSH